MKSAESRSDIWEPRGSQSSAEGPRQLWVPPARRLISFGASEGTTEGEVAFRVEIPDARLTVKRSLVGVGASGAPNFLAGKNLTLWLYAVEDALTGGGAIPVTDLEGTQAAPLVIPVSSGLGGYSREFTTSADAIEGVVALAGAPASTADGQLVLQARYQPTGQRLPWHEWEEIKRACNVALRGPEINNAA